MNMWALVSFAMIIIVILSIIPMTIIGIQKMNKGQLNNYFVHRIVSGRIWRHIKDENTVTVLSFTVKCFLLISYFCLMVGISILLVGLIGTQYWNWYIWPSLICLAFCFVAVVFQVLANRTFKQDCANLDITA
ncbi:hypothetical protein [Paenilisteria rocourtiae]|nr:hypothetical protein [Listeria rocourtiae]EUJ51039.1 hypothetical protein PROCOU_02984 [Listeria rocourtiae FSL F6-920]